MTREKVLTAHWNNILSTTLALIASGYVIFVLLNSGLSEHSGFVGLAVIGSFT